MKHSFLLVQVVLVSVALLGMSSCGSTKYNSDYNLNQAQLKKANEGGALAIAEGDTAKPSVKSKQPLKSDEGKLEEKKKKKKPNKRYFLGHKVKRGFIRSGGRGDREILETFSYLAEYVAPDPYAPEKYYYDTKREKLYRTRGDADPAKHKILHGPYQKKRGDKVIEEGYFYVGTKHLRWETYRNDEAGTLVNKLHYDKGFPRDAVVTYYDNDPKRLKEVIPYLYGEVQGTYYRFYENGQVQWAGKYEKGRKVGVWINYYDFRGRRHYEYQYPESCYDEPFEPYLIKEYDRHGSLVYEKDKLDKRQAQR